MLHKKKLGKTAGLFSCLFRRNCYICEMEEDRK
jgi:hypothetical protein